MVARKTPEELIRPSTHCTPMYPKTEYISARGYTSVTLLAKFTLGISCPVTER